MAKTKSPTPQELYKQRKQHEEEEKDALLPPGLWNHGNTCFMNSVLQGLIATRFLSELVHFQPLSPAFTDDCLNGTQLTPASRRSPLLINGYGQAGDYEQDWIDTMPIGDVFIQLALKAWKSQNERRRESLSPKPLLTTLGKKYDQYLDFAQQDAHEFLRILLDATRMEEQDEIKKRQPQLKPRKRRRTTIIPNVAAQSPANDGTPPPIPDEDKLVSLADMVFGGKLTSILVCQKCKHVSQTFEEFNDISLSIQAEDYQKRKRNRLKNLARKFAAFPLSSSATPGSNVDVPRPSSVPPSPKERDLKQQGGLLDPPIASDPRRQSLDVVRDPLPEGSAVSSREDVSVAVATEDSSATLADIVIVEKPEQSPPAKSERAKDNWSKFGKRISASIGLGKAWKDSEKERNVLKHSARMSLESSRPSAPSPSPLSTTENSSSSTRKAPSSSVPLNTATPETTHGPTPAIILSRPPSPPPATQSPAPIAPTPIPSLKPSNSPRMSEPQRSKSPKPPKPSAGELAYLREILADISPPSTSGGLGNLLKPPHAHLFHPQLNGSKAESTAAPPSQSLWLSMSQYSGIEECLRMFTTVEILDGENMVGCRQCWKIANGQIPTNDNVEDSDNAEKEHEEDNVPALVPPTSRPSLRLSPPTVYIPTSISTPTVTVFSYPDNDDRRSVSSLPIDVSSPTVDNSDTDASSEPEQGAEKSQQTQSLPVASGSNPPDKGPSAISAATRSHSARPNGSSNATAQPMTRSVSAPTGDTTDTTPTPAAQKTPRLTQIAARPLPSPPANTQHDTLTPPTRRPRHEREPDGSSSAESEASSVATEESRQPSRTGSTDSNLPPSLARPRKSTKTSKPKPTIMRPAYKRYLIAVPPPVLVIHLKRFQQVNKVPMISFTQYSHGFKKLEDYVSFPEYLDVTPYLAPRKEDFGLGKGKSKVRKGTRKKEKCMYRLYAVIVHLGNMLGGHYIAYTALPESHPFEESSQQNDAEKTSSPQSPSPRKWAYISDTVVRLTTLEEVLKAKAYLCMYERI